MAVKTITVDLEAYRLLAADKRADESFSKVIKRRFVPVRTARALADKLDTLVLAEDTLDRVEELLRARVQHMACSPVLWPTGRSRHPLECGSGAAAFLARRRGGGGAKR
jgi:predicted CopG family antitoxin